MPAVVLDRMSGEPLAWSGCGEGAEAPREVHDLDRVRALVVRTDATPRHDMAMAARSPE